MADFFEIDFLSVNSPKSGDAIPLRYKVGELEYIHVVDGGFQKTGESLAAHIREYYGQSAYIDNVVATHPDGDHAGGLRTILEEFEVGALWMHRPWLYAHDLIDGFARFTKPDNLAKRLKEIYPNIAMLEEIADEQNIPIFEAFQGAKIGEFTVMAPTRKRFLDLVVESEKTPEVQSQKEDVEEKGLLSFVSETFDKLIKAIWGDENFSDEPTSAENEMSIVQYAQLCGKKILLTGDAGRKALLEAAEYAPHIGLDLPGIDRIQIPHHGSRRNVSSKVLDTWLGNKYESELDEADYSSIAVVSAAKEDENHPRNAVVRGFMHRGSEVLSTESGSKRISSGAPDREGWVPATPLQYPVEQEVL